MTTNETQTLTVRNVAPLEERLGEYAVMIPEVCDSDETMKTITEIAEGEKALIKEIEEFFRDDKKRAHDLHKSLCAKEKTLLAPPQSRLETLRSVGQEWITKKRQLAIEQERKRQEEIRKQQQEAERKRLAEAEAAKANSIRNLLSDDDDDPAPPPEPPPPPPPAPVVVPSVGKGMGVATRKQWTFRVTDIHAFLAHALKDVSLFALINPIKATPGLVEAVVDGVITDLEISIDGGRMKQLVREKKEKFSIAGIEAFQEELF
jgi:hypothetical protein